MIRTKLILKNVFGKPLRTFIIILSLTAATFTALFSISGVNSSKNALHDFFRSNFGDADIMIYGDSASAKINEEDIPPEGNVLTYTLSGITMTAPNHKYFNYVNQVGITIIGMDTQKAYEMKLLDKAYPTEDGITVTKSVSERFEEEVGFDMRIEGSGGKEYKYEILDIAIPSRFLRDNTSAIITTPEVANEIAGRDKDSYTTMLIDMPDDMVADTIASLSEKYPEMYIFGTTSNDSDETMMSTLSIYYLIFAVVFLMVCFIVVSMSKHIINERMSLVGMLRSIGGSIGGTGMILLCESAFYGLCGGVIGTILFLPFRASGGLDIFGPSGDLVTEVNDGITPLTILAVIAGAVLIQCLFTIAAIMKAARKPVRDIIFGTRETAYTPSVIFTVLGILLLAAGTAVYNLFDDFSMVVLAALCSAVGAVLMLPVIVKLVSKIFALIFGKLGLPTAKLAAKEISSKKSSISSFQLIFSAISLTIAVSVLSFSISSFFTEPVYQGDLIINSPESDGDRYDFVMKNIDDVEEMEKIYYNVLTYDYIGVLNGEKRNFTVVGYDNSGFKFFTGIDGCPDKLSENEAVVDKILASKLSLNVGDEIKLGLKTEKFLPCELTLKIKSLCDAGRFNSMGNTIMINLDTYKKVYFDRPSTILIKTKPGTQAQVLDILHSSLSDDPTQIETIEQFNEEAYESMYSILYVIYAIIVLGTALALSGTFSNMIMGFEQSRRKYAIYYSTSMSKSKLRKLIILETLFTAGLSCIASVLFGLYFLNIISKALSLLEMSVPLVQPVYTAVVSGIAVFLILLITAVKPVRLLSKMNISEEIKTSAD